LFHQKSLRCSSAPNAGAFGYKLSLNLLRREMERSFHFTAQANLGR